MDSWSESSLETDGCPVSIDKLSDLSLATAPYRPKDCISPEIENETKRKRQNGDSSDSCLLWTCNDDGERHNSSGSSSSDSSGDSNQATYSSDEDSEANMKTKVGHSKDGNNYSTYVANATVDNNVISIPKNENNSEDEVSDQIAVADVWSKDVFTQDEDGDTLLHMAVIALLSSIAVTIIELASKNKMLLNIMNSMFQTPLHLAVLTEQYQIVDQLLAANACIHLRDKKGRTPLHIACDMRDALLSSGDVLGRRNSILSVVKQLLKCDSNCQYIDNHGETAYPTKICSWTKQQTLNLQNSDGNSCIHTACLNGDIEMVKILVDNGADINLPDVKSGRTMLHFAVEAGDIRMVKYLLEVEGLDINKKTRGDETAFAIAFHRKHTEIAAMLKKSNAAVDFKYLAKFGVVSAEMKKRCRTDSTQ